MNLPDWVTTLVYTISVSTGSATLTWLILKRWIGGRIKHEKKMVLMDIKIDCIVEGLCSINHGMGKEFKIGYEKSMSERIRNVNFVEKT